MANQPTITEQLRQIVIDSGKRQQDIAAATGLSQSIISQFKRGEGVSGSSIDKLAEYFGMRLVKARKARK